MKQVTKVDTAAIRERTSLLAFRRRIAAIAKPALRGDSNDAEHDALFLIAQLVDPNGVAAGEYLNDDERDDLMREDS